MLWQAGELAHESHCSRCHALMGASSSALHATSLRAPSKLYHQGGGERLQGFQLVCRMHATYWSPHADWWSEHARPRPSDMRHRCQPLS